MTERARLTDALALAARPREREYAIHDAALQGFMLRVQPNGARSWVFRFRRDGKPRRVTLGKPLLNLAEELGNVGQRRGLIQGGDLLFQQRQIVDRIEDHIIPLVRTGGPGDDPAAATDNHLMDIATDPDLPVAVGDGHGIVIRPVAHQRQGADPRALPVAGIERRRRQNHQRFAIAPEALADSLTVAAHDLALPVAALFLQLGIEGVLSR